MMMIDRRESVLVFGHERVTIDEEMNANELPLAITLWAASGCALIVMLM